MIQFATPGVLSVSLFANPDLASESLAGIFGASKVMHRTFDHDTEYVTVCFRSWASGPATIPKSLARYFCQASALGAWVHLSVSFVELSLQEPMMHIVVSDSSEPCASVGRPGFCAPINDMTFELFRVYLVGASHRAFWGNSLNDGSVAMRGESE